VKQREPQLIVVTGQKGVGKTYTTTQRINSYIQPNPQTGKNPRKVLIFDVNQEYEQYKAIAIEDVARFTAQQRPEIRRVLPFDEEGKLADIDGRVTIMRQILSDYSGGLLLLEDINQYLLDTNTQDIIGVLCTNRHRDLDIIIHLQSLSPVTTRMWQNCSVVRFHKQLDDIQRYENRIPNFELFKIGQILVDTQYKNGNKRFYCYVSSDEAVIRGAFTKRAFQEACEEYALQYPTQVNRIKKRYGTGAEAQAKATKDVVERLLQYNGNKR